MLFSMVKLEPANHNHKKLTLDLFIFISFSHLRILNLLIKESYMKLISLFVAFTFSAITIYVKSAVL